MDFVRYMTRVYYICTIIVHYYNMKNNYSKRLMDVIEYSREEAARLQNSYIGPEHLMLGIIRDGEGKAVQEAVLTAPSILFHTGAAAW